MSKRLVDTYAIGEKVQILLDDEWHPGMVISHDHPGVWVRTDENRALWFVTNGKRIGKRGDKEADQRRDDRPDH